MSESPEVIVNLKPLREQIEAMSALLKQAEKYPLKLVETLDRCAKEIKEDCGGMGARVMFR